MTGKRKDNGEPSGGLAARLRRMAAAGNPAAGVPGAGALGPAHTGDAVPRAPRPLMPAAPPEGWEALDEYTWRRRTTVRAACPAFLSPSPLLPSGGNTGNFVFFDTETTGLSGGAGTIAFLIGLGAWDGETLTVDQFFLKDYPGENTFLDFVLGHIDPQKTYVSYNGKAFDAQILKTRCIMTGRRFPAIEQLDLLYPVRRLWGDALPSCSLLTVEEHILGTRRETDIPGILIPDIYFEFLKAGATDRLEPGFSHHLQDIVSLERLLAHITRVLEDRGGDPYASGYRLGRWLIDTGFPEGAHVLKRAFERGDQAAGSYLAATFKHLGRYDEAASVWTAMLEREWNPHAAFELAKYAEHKARDFALAERFTLRILAAATGPGHLRSPEPVEGLAHRLERIRRKAAKA